MRPPPLLLGAVLLFWGWRLDLLWVGALAGALIELPHAVKGRWDFSDKEFNRLWDVCTIIFVAVAAYLRFAEELTSGAYKFFQWLPLVFFLMALGCVFSTRDSVPMKAFSWFLRRKGAERGDRPVSFLWIYLIVCLVAAGATNERDPWFFLCATGLAGWSLWSFRPRRIPDFAWLALFAGIASGAFALQSRAPEAQSFFEGKLSELLVHLGRRDFDPNQSRTAMGRIGQLKQSSRIVMKVTPETGPAPERLREAVLTRFETATWRGGRSAFDQVSIEPDTTTWTLVTNTQASGSVRIAQRAIRDSEILALPHATVQLRDLLSGAVSTNLLGAVKAEENPGLMDFTALTSSTVSFDVPWRQFDLEVPEEEEPALQAVSDELNLPDAMSDRERIAAIGRFFSDKFRYTTYQEARELELNRRTPLAEFLLTRRSGHCEHFATATVLLLRHYRIPARYVVGYALTGEELEGESHIVRERDGHAWVLAWIRDRWVEVDTTPADWSQREKREFPFYQRLKDSWGRFTFGFLEWRWLGDWGFIRIAAPWLIAPMVGFLAWRIFGRKMSVRKRPVRESMHWPGADSEFFALERKLAKTGLARTETETLREWTARLAADAPAAAELLPDILQLHHRYRFDPSGLDAAERKQLREMAQACAARL